MNIINEKRSVGRPRLEEETDYLRVRVPKKLLVIAEGLGIPYKKMIKENFEKILCVAILAEKGIDGCEICEKIIERNKVINEEYENILLEFTHKLTEENKETVKITEFIRTHPGLLRGELETEYGHVFPDAIWKKYGGTKQ